MRDQARTRALAGLIAAGLLVTACAGRDETVSPSEGSGPVYDASSLGPATSNAETVGQSAGPGAASPRSASPTVPPGAPDGDPGGTADRGDHDATAKVDRWADTTYGVDGSLVGHRYGLNRSFDLPSRMRTHWAPGPGQLQLLGWVEDGGIAHLLGFALPTTDPERLATIGGLFLIVPFDDGSTGTFGFVCDHPIEFRGLSNGASDGCTTVTDDFAVTTRRDGALLEVRVQPVGDQDPPEHFYRGAFTITDSRDLPWDKTTIGVDVASGSGTLTGKIELSRQPA